MRLDRRLRVALLVAFRAITMAALFFGLNTLAAAFLIPASRPDATIAWLDSIRAMAWGLALTLLPGAAGALILMPSRSDILRRAEPSEGGAFPWALRLLMLGLAAVSAIQALPITQWWSESSATLERVVGPGYDPSGWSAFPAAILFSIPTFSTAAVLSFALTSALMLTVRPKMACRVLWACVSLQAGLAIAGALTLHRLLMLAMAAATRLSADPDMAAVGSELGVWISRQHALGGSVTRGLLLILGGYLAAAAAATWLAAPRGIGRSATEALEPRAIPAPPSISPSDASRAEPSRAPSAASGAFDRSTFVIQPRVTFASFLTRRHGEYDIWAYGDARGGRMDFSFSWATGVIRRKPAGPDVVAVRRRSAGWLSQAYDVIDLSTQALLATLRPDKPDWEVLDSRGEPMAQVQAEIRIGRHRYVARVAGAEICRFSWHLGSRDALNPELEIEFAPDADGRLDRAVAIALGPLLEQDARLAHQPF